MTEQSVHATPTHGFTEEWMSPKEICHELQIPEQTFYQWRVKGIGPHAYRIGRHLRITRSDLDAWLAQRSDP